MVKYDCDVWGNHRVLDGNGNENTSSSFIGNINPFRYKGYYYDQESNMYYCKSRYYVPQWCRWLNADSVNFLNPQNIHELNLFAYCKNNPVMYVDPSGQFPWLIALAVLLLTPIGGTLTQVAVSTVSYVGIAVASIFNEDIRNDMNAIGWNPFNGDASKASKFNSVSFYKGVPVFKINVQKNTSFSFFIIGLNSSHQGDVSVLNHERGHNTQLMTMGILKYGLFIGIPSPLKNDDNTPWELSASILGNSSSADGTSNRDKALAMIYYAFACTNNPLLLLIDLGIMVFF